jgi:hypothetical protein
VSPGEFVEDANLDPDAPLRWSTGAMTASGFAVVPAEVASRDRPSVLECGSGFSAAKLAELTDEGGGRWSHSSMTSCGRSNLAAAGLNETAQVTPAPSAAAPARARWIAVVRPARAAVPSPGGWTCSWSTSAGSILRPSSAAIQRCRRSPSASRLAQSWCSTDFDRAGELQVLGAWERECSLRFEIQPAKPIASAPSLTTATLYKVSERARS